MWIESVVRPLCRIVQGKPADLVRFTGIRLDPHVLVGSKHFTVGVYPVIGVSGVVDQ